jgi:hypothetical protein
VVVVVVTAVVGVVWLVDVGAIVLDGEEVVLGSVVEVAVPVVWVPSSEFPAPQPTRAINTIGSHFDAMSYLYTTACLRYGNCARGKRPKPCAAASHPKRATASIIRAKKFSRLTFECSRIS